MPSDQNRSDGPEQTVEMFMKCKESQLFRRQKFRKLMHGVYIIQKHCAFSLLGHSSKQDGMTGNWQRNRREGVLAH